LGPRDIVALRKRKRPLALSGLFDFLPIFGKVSWLRSPATTETDIPSRWSFSGSVARMACAAGFESLCSIPPILRYCAMPAVADAIAIKC